MRIALVSPYSWTYQGGVNRHVEALAEQFIARGDHVRVLAPWDPPDRISRRLHRSHPELREAPDYLVPLGRTIGFGANGAVSNLSVVPGGPACAAPRAARRQLRRRPRPRAAGAAGRLGRDGLSRRAGRRHLPRLLDQGLPQPPRDAARRSTPLQPALGAYRGLRGSRLDGAPLVRRRVHDRSQRGRHRGRPAGARSRRATSFGCSSSAARRSARACRFCSPHSRRWSSTSPRG